MYADGIGIDYERAVRIAKAHYAVLLLQEAEQQAYSHSQDSSNDADEPTLKEEYFLNKAVTRPKGPQRFGILPLVDYEHRERTNDIE